MKNFIVFILVILGIIPISQSQNYLENYQRFFNGLRLQQPSNHAVIDMAAPQIDPLKYNGSNLDQVVQLDQAEELMRIMHSLIPNQYKADFPNWDSLLIWAKGYIDMGVMPLVLIDYRYQKLSDSFWIEQGYEYDSDSNWLRKTTPWKSSDFSTGDAFCLIPLMNHWNNKIHSVVFDKRFMLTNRNPSSNFRLGIDINGQNHYLIPNMPSRLFEIREGLNLCFLFLEADTNNEHFAINTGIQMNLLGGMKRLVSKFHLYSNPHLPDWQTIKNGLPIDDFEVSTYVKSESGTIKKTGANVSIHYSNSANNINNCLNKPIVFVEGIDFGYRGWPTGCRDGKCGNTGYIDLLKGKQWDVESQTWADWKSIENSPAVLKQYRDSGYDIIYIDFWDGADFIENNAVVVKEVLVQIQQRLCGKHIHVVGASMGSLVAKRALTMLENEIPNHCVRSYTSFDGPLLGANIPLGLQVALNYYTPISGKIRDLKERMLDRPAAKQMLLLHYQNQDQAHEYRSKFMRDSSLQAFPLLPWKFAITNGSNQMTFQYADNLQKLTEGDSLMHFNIAQPLFDNVKAYAKLIGGKTLYTVVSVLPESDAKLYLYSHGISGNTNGKGTVGTFKTTYKKEFNHWVEPYASSYDHVAGGMSDVTATFHNSLRKQSWLIFSEKYTSNTCFIPTWSALSSDSAKIKYTRPLKQTIGNQFLLLRNTPFDNYYSQTENQDHVFFDYAKGGNADWLLGEIIHTEKQIYPVQQNTIYIGKPYDRFLGDVVVNEGETLNVNGDFSSAGLAPMEKNAVLRLQNRTFVLGNCQPSTIRVKPNATFVIHSGLTQKQPTQFICQNESVIIVDSGSTLCVNNAFSKLILRKNSHLFLKSGSTLIIENGSQFIAEENSTLHIGKNVRIHLRGESALLHIKGTLILENEAKLDIQSEGLVPVGLLKLSNMGGGFGQCKIQNEGSAYFNLIGNGSQGATVLQIEGDVNCINCFNDISINNARVQFGNHSQWSISGNIQVENSGFFSTEWSHIQQNGVRVTEGHLTVKNCVFGKQNTAIQCLESVKMTVENSTIQQCTTGLLVSSNRFKVINTTFKKNTVAIELHGSNHHDTVSASEFSDNTTGISVLGNDKTAPLHLLENNFHRNEIGIKCNSRTLALRCNVFGINTTDIQAYESKIVAGANSTIMGEKDTLLCGNNTFAFAKKRNIQMDYSCLFLNGENNFLCATDREGSDRLLVAGTIPNNCTAPWNTSNTIIQLGKNYWFPVRNPLSFDSVKQHYIALGVVDIGGKWQEINVSGSLRSTVNTTCFDIQSLLDQTKSSNSHHSASWNQQNIGYATDASIWIQIPKNAVIYTMDGKEIAPTTNKDKWSDNLSPGFYLIRFQDPQGQWISKRIFYSATQ